MIDYRYGYSYSYSTSTEELPTTWQAPPVQHAQKMLHAQLLLPGVHELPAVPRSVPGPRVRLTDVDYSTEAQGATARKLQMMRNSSLGNFAASTAVTATSVHRLMLVMVGLPARGKSFIARKLCRYLNWLGYSCKVFNLGSYRRQNLGSYHPHDFFKPDNPEVASSPRSIHRTKCTNASMLLTHTRAQMSRVRSNEQRLRWRHSPMPFDGTRSPTVAWPSTTAPTARTLDARCCSIASSRSDPICASRPSSSRSFATMPRVRANSASVSLTHSLANSLVL